MDIKPLLDAIARGAVPRIAEFEFEQVTYDPRGESDQMPWAAVNGAHVSRWHTVDIRLHATREFAASEAARLDAHGAVEHWETLLDGHQPARNRESGWAVRHVHPGQRALCFRFWPVNIPAPHRALLLLDDKHTVTVHVAAQYNGDDDMPGTCAAPFPTGTQPVAPMRGPAKAYHLRITPAFMIPE